MSRLYAWLIAAFAIADIADGRPQRNEKQLPTAFGIASWYGWWHDGRITADGHRFQALADGAASLTLPLGSAAKITNLENGRSVIVRITDRGPFVRGRIIDVSLGTAMRLGMVQAGVVRVRVDPIPDDPAP